MRNEVHEDFTIIDLKIQKLGLEDRIARLEADYREQAIQTSNKIILKRFLEVERSNLRKINFELEKKK